MKVYKTATSNELIRKYEKLGFKLLYFTYTGNDTSTLIAHMLKEQ